MLCTFAVVQPAQALVPLVIGAFVLGTLVGGIIGGYLAAQASRQALIDSVNWQYVNDSAINFENLVSSSTQEFTNEKALIANLDHYFARKAEYAAQYYINESTFPYDKVMTYSGLQDEYDNITGTVKAQLEALNDVAEGYAEVTFTGDLSDFYVGSESFKSGTSTFTTTDLTSSDLQIVYGLQETWGANTPSGLTWTLVVGGGLTAYENYMSINEMQTTNQLYSSTFTIQPNTTLTIKLSTYTSRTDINQDLNTAIYYANGTQITNSSQSSKTNGIKTYTFSNLCQTATADQNVYIQFLRTCGSGYSGTGWLSSFSLVASNTEESQKDSFYPYLADSSNQGLTYYAFRNSTAIQREVGVSALLKANQDYVNTFKATLRNAMSAAQAYHTYLRGLGYTDYSQIPTLIPPLDVVMPATNSTFWTSADISTEEYYAIFAAYMQSLNDLFSNSTVARTISEVDTRNITMTNMPVYATGRIFDNSSNTWTGFCSSIWVQPLAGNITLTKGQNCTLGTTSQIVYRVNSTGTITYLQGAANDIIEVTDIQLKGTNGAWSTQDAVTLSTASLETYATTYITGYEGIDYPETPLAWGTAAMTSLIILVVIMSALGSAFNKKKR